jgi:hypothetical protein
VVPRHAIGIEDLLNVFIGKRERSRSVREHNPRAELARLRVEIEFLLPALRLDPSDLLVARVALPEAENRLDFDQDLTIRASCNELVDPRGAAIAEAIRDRDRQRFAG